METSSTQNCLSVTLNDRRRYSEIDVHRLDTLLCFHKGEKEVFDRTYQQLYTDIVRANTIQHDIASASDEPPSVVDALMEEVAEHCESAENIRFLYNASREWLQLLLNHRDDLIEAGFRISDACSYLNQAIVHATVTDTYCRNQVRLLGLRSPSY